MTGELFLAAVLFAAGCSVTVYLLLAARINRHAERSGAGDDFDLTPIETRLSDLVTDMNRVANSHTQAIADRKDELKRVIEMANERIRRLNTLLADMTILEQRMRDPRRSQPESFPGDEPRQAPRAAARAVSEGGARTAASSPGTPIPVTDTVVEDDVADARWTPSDGPSGPSRQPARSRTRPPLEHAVSAEGGSWVFEVPGPVDGQERARDIESLAADGLSPAAIASRLRLPLHAVEEVLGGRGRH